MIYVQYCFYTCMYTYVVEPRDICWSFGFLYDFSLTSGLTAVTQEVAVWLLTACPHFEKV